MGLWGLCLNTCPGPQPERCQSQGEASRPRTGTPPHSLCVWDAGATGRLPEGGGAEQEGDLPGRAEGKPAKSSSRGRPPLTWPHAHPPGDLLGEARIDSALHSAPPWAQPRGSGEAGGPGLRCLETTALPQGGRGGRHQWCPVPPTMLQVDAEQPGLLPTQGPGRHRESNPKLDLHLPPLTTTHGSTYVASDGGTMEAKPAWRPRMKARTSLETRMLGTLALGLVAPGAMTGVSCKEEAWELLGVLGALEDDGCLPWVQGRGWRHLHQIFPDPAQTSIN